MLKIILLVLMLLADSLILENGVLLLLLKVQYKTLKQFYH